ncbi:MAG TPA: FAD-dependent oxidoreductase [Actinospica sp.]|nr:FAD-dependent oxidoreductase [Actinospica sp.]HWG28585.1 FAD-dependent oxidoreductase [Actinospica sp.]
MSRVLMSGVLIVGGGIAGVSTAAALRAGGFDGDVTLVDEGEFPYDRPPLSKEYLAGARDVKQLALQPPEWYDEQRIQLINRTRATALHGAEGAVELDSGAVLRADRVVLATGGHAARPPIPGADNDRVHVLRTLADADRLRAALNPGARVLVVGAGLIGAETASTMTGLGCEVVIADPEARPLEPVLGPEFAAWLHGQHAVRGIETVQQTITSFGKQPNGIRAYFGGGRAPEDFDAVLLGVGMVPRVELAKSAGLVVERGIVVDARHASSHPNVLVVGDPARMRVSGVLHPSAEHWDAAQVDGARAAAAILGTAPPPASAPWFWTDRHGRHIEAVGRLAEAERAVLRGAFADPSFSMFGLVGDHVVAAASVDEPNAVRTARRLIDRRIPVDASRLADTGTNLRTLLRG